MYDVQPCSENTSNRHGDESCCSRSAFKRRRADWALLSVVMLPQKHTHTQYKRADTRTRKHTHTQFESFSPDTLKDNKLWTTFGRNPNRRVPCFLCLTFDWISHRKSSWKLHRTGGLWNTVYRMNIAMLVGTGVPLCVCAGGLCVRVRGRVCVLDL